MVGKACRQVIEIKITVVDLRGVIYRYRSRIKNLIIMTLLQNIVISGAQGLLMLMGSKVLIQMIRLQNINIKEQCFATWSSLSNILIPSTSGELKHPK